MYGDDEVVLTNRYIDGGAWGMCVCDVAQHENMNGTTKEDQGSTSRWQLGKTKTKLKREETTQKRKVHQFKYPRHLVDPQRHGILSCSNGK